LNWQGNTLLAAGRTDTGVHASGQVVSFDLEWDHPDEELLRAFNANLPKDIAARRVSQVVDNFHPRYDALSRIYVYRIFCQPSRNPLLERYAWRVWPEARIVSMQKAAAFLLGRHDFAAFGTAPRLGGSTIRNVYLADWEQKEPYLEFTIRADAFLYHMVRRLVFLLVEIGQGRLPLEAARGYVQGQATDALQGLAPPQGLILAQVDYGDGRRGSPEPDLVEESDEQ
jgi:tRNA pseudouridine38-40 synthase